MRKILIVTLFIAGVVFTAKSQSVSTTNVKKSKNTGSYSSKSHSEPKSYEKKKFFLADAFQNRSKRGGTENEKKPQVSKPRNPYANNEQTVVKSKHGVSSK